MKPAPTSKSLQKQTLDSAFATSYTRLNRAQKQAVDEIEGPVMVIAGPGTGKTTILTLRIANILKRTDTPAHGILAITYTDAGVRAMRTKLHGIIGARAHEIQINTFHSFASSIISEYPDHFVHLRDTKQMTDVEQETLIRTIISDPKFADLRPLGKPDAYLSNILRSIDESKREAVTPVMVKSFALAEIERIKNDPEALSTRGATKGQLKAESKEDIAKAERTLLFADVYELYEAKKTEAKKMDFNDLIIELLLALRHDELLLRLVQERFLYLHVDEHQDTNDAQNFIIGLIAEFFETPNVFIVGDEKQAIYRFQGASVENFLLLQKKWPTMKLISLDMNYRSHQGILDATWDMIEHNYEGDAHKDLRVKLSSGLDDEPQPIEIVTAENSAAAEIHLVNELKKLKAEEPSATAAIIVRRNRDLDRIIRLLETHGISVSSERSVDVFNHPIGSLFFELIQYISDPSRVDALGKTIAAGMWDLSFEQSTELISALRAGLHTAKGKAVEIDKRIPALKKIQALIMSDGAVGAVIHAAEESGFTKLVSSDPTYVHVWRAIVALAESIARDGRIREPLELMKQLLAYRLSAEQRPVKVTVGTPDLPLQAMTAHGSKGLEFDYVFIPYATEEAWMGRNRGSSFTLPKKKAASHDIQDVRRLFYVALTRARRHVTVMVPLEESDGSQYSPLRFLSEISEKNLSQSLLPRVGVETVVERRGTPYSALRTKLSDLAKRVLMAKGLSVTALNHFIECPSKFLYQSILKLPQAPAAAAEKGSAMHLALSRVWAVEGRTDPSSFNAELIEAVLVQGIGEFLEESLLPSAEKETVKKELLENAPAVAKSLLLHFEVKGGVKTESWVKQEFAGEFEGKPVLIPIHGKLDAILDTTNEVFVYDYKTRQAMSENAIKGLTKNSDGGYFRQLIFYKLLLAADPFMKTRRIQPALVFVTPDDKGRCPTMALPITDEDMTRVRGEIQQLIESVWTGKVADGKCKERDCEWCGLLNAVK
ncbi:MAG: ATP-dependent DNA helicase [Patescibacteria group bacterium]